MPKRPVPLNQRWQIIGMHQTGMSCRAIGAQLNINHTVISRLIRKHTDFGEVKDARRSGRPRKTTDRDDRALVRQARRSPKSTCTQLRHGWHPFNRVSISTIRRRLNFTGLRARRPIRRPLVTNQHRHARLAWCQARARWNLRTWRRIHWSDESRFLLHHTDGRARVWRERGTAYDQRNIQCDVPFGGGSVMVWGCCSYDCKLDLITVPGTLNGLRYQNLILDGAVVAHFDNHALATRPVFMDDNARPHRARAVVQHLQHNAIETLPWPARSPDMNPIEHLWDILGRRVRARDPPVQNLQELTHALHDEWQQIPQQKIRRLVSSMRRRVENVIHVRGGYTRY